eukprot:2128265-Pleurochrysis_carterae.AAC.2
MCAAVICVVQCIEIQRSREAAQVHVWSVSHLLSTLSRKSSALKYILGMPSLAITALDCEEEREKGRANAQAWKRRENRERRGGAVATGKKEGEGRSEERAREEGGGPRA